MKSRKATHFDTLSHNLAIRGYHHVIFILALLTLKGGFALTMFLYARHKAKRKIP